MDGHSDIWRRPSRPHRRWRLRPPPAPALRLAHAPALASTPPAVSSATPAAALDAEVREAVTRPPRTSRSTRARTAASGTGRANDPAGERDVPHCLAADRFLHYRPEAARRFGNCLRKCAAGAAAQAPLGLNAGCTTAFIARQLERSGSAIRTPFGAWFSQRTQRQSARLHSAPP